MDDLSRQGIDHYNGGRFKEALRCFRAAVAADKNVPKAPEARVFLGHVAGSLGRRPEAIASFTSVIRDFPRHLPAYSGLANILLHLSPVRDPAAEKTLLSLLSLTPGEAGFRAQLAETLRSCGQALRAAGELEAAEKVLSKALILGGQSRASRRRLIDVMHLRSDAYIAAGELNKAEKELRKVLELEPGHEAARRGLVKILRKRGLAHVSKGRLREAEKTLRRAVVLAPRDKKSRRQRAAVRLMRDKSLRARAQAVRREKTESLRLLRRRSEAAVTAGRLEHAEAALRRALLVGSRKTEVGRQLAEVLLMREHAEQSRVKAARLAKAEKIRVLLEKLKSASQSYKSAGWADKAETLLSRTLKIDPEDPRAHLLAGGILFSSGAVVRGRALITKALTLDQGTLLPSETFTALMKLGRYKAAIAAAEATLDGRPTLADIRAFWDPWEWEDHPIAARRRELQKLSSALRGSRSPWASYYRADLHGPDEARHLLRLAGVPRPRYGWMLAKTGLSALCAGRFHEAEQQLRAGLKYKTRDWRTRGFLAEALLCLRRQNEAFAQMDRARAEAPGDEQGQVVAWRGALDLWLGRYDQALARFDAALTLGAPYAQAWRAAALLKLGRAREALKQLDAALKLYPRDFEAYVWRGEAKRELGLYRAALKDLNEPALAGANRATPIWLWALFNRALVKAALGDRAGLKSDFNAIPVDIRDYIRRRTGHDDMEKLLAAGLELSRGFRREEYKQAIWMR